jgi:Gpi18-like mannosyltransferase
MSADAQSSLAVRLQRLFPKEDIGYLLASLLLQLILGLLLGHVYDQRIFMATGYLVATGQNPYIPQDLTAIFNHTAFQGMTSIGYPPLWPLILGFIYQVSYAPIHNLLIYNLAIKLPVIIANLSLAYLVRDILNKLGQTRAVSRKAWLFLLFNPFVLYFTIAWGQFDSLVALLTLASLVLLDKQKIAISSILLAMAIALKPTPIPVVLVALVYLWESPWHRLFRFLASFTISMFTFCILPFIIMNWDASPILLHWNAHFTVSGGMSFMTFYELVKDTYLLPGMWWLLGFAWLPAILLGMLLTKTGSRDFITLLKQSLALILIFFLTRTWTSEQNLMLILPMVLILTYLGELPKICLTATWVLPLIFTFFNTSPPQLLFPVLPELMENLLRRMDVYRSGRLAARMIVVIPWQIIGWWMVVGCLRKTKSIPG